MSSIEQAAIGQVRIFGVGGCGINIAHYFEEDRGTQQPGVAEAHITYVDTSLSAIPTNVSAEHFYKLQGADGETDGSGGKRSHNAEDIMERNKEILHKHPPLDLTIIVGSMTGGSGSVFANALADELMAQDKPVVVLGVGDDATLQFVKNTISSLTSYHNYAEKHGRPISVVYRHNGEDGTISEVNAHMHKIISTLLVLFSRQNRLLDSRDLYNALNFNQVTSFKPQVGLLSVNFGDLNIGDEQLISLLTLSSNLDNTRVSQLVEYQRVGLAEKFIEADGGRSLFKDDIPVHIAITDGYLDKVMSKLKKLKKKHEDNAAQRTVRNRLGDDKLKTTASGLALDD